MNEIIQSELFEPLIEHIQCGQPGDNYLEILIPVDFVFDKEKVLQYFNEDILLQYKRDVSGQLRTVIKGRLKDDNLYNYLMAKYYQRITLTFKEL